MAEVWFIPFIAIAVISITAVIFGVWVTVVTVKGVLWLIGTLFLSPLLILRRRARMRLGRCGEDWGFSGWPNSRSTGSPGGFGGSAGSCRDCGQENPTAARFCRRCGAALKQS